MGPPSNFNHKNVYPLGPARTNLSGKGGRRMKRVSIATPLVLIFTLVWAHAPASGQSASAPSFSPANIKDELPYQRATQSYLWALPLLNMRAMKEGSEAKFGEGYNVLPIGNPEAAPQDSSKPPAPPSKMLMIA